MGMSRSSYYYKPKNKDERKKRDKDLCTKIRAICPKVPILRLQKDHTRLKEKESSG